MTNTNVINDKQFNNTIKTIKTSSDNLAASIHEAGLFAIMQANLHGNNGFAQRLVEAMGKKHDAQRVVTWLCFFGKLGVKKGEMIYKNRKDITAENAQVFINNADATPYWDLTKQKELKETYDWLASLHAMTKRHEKMELSVKEGRDVTELHPEAYSMVKELLIKLGNVPVIPATKDVVTI